MRYLYLILSVTFAVLSITACSKGSDVVIPADEFEKANTYENLPAGVSEYFDDGFPAGGMGALGVFQLHINPSKKSAELITLRQGTLVDVVEVVDIANFLTMSPCTDCAKINSVELDADSNVVVSIGIKHPFDVGNPELPITGRNRGDLHVFNVEGIVVSAYGAKLFPGLNMTIADFLLVNANGYTGYLDEVLDTIYPTDADIHPYIMHFDDYSQGNFDASNPMGFASVTTPPPSGNTVMAMGCDYSYQNYIFDLSEGPIDLFYVVGCTYGVSSEAKRFRFNPEYRIPQHMKKAASEISVEIIRNDMIFSDPESSADIEVHVVDRSHGVSVGTNLDQMLSDSSVDDIFIDIPGILTLPLVLDGNNAISGTGHDPSDPLVYQAEIVNSNLAAADIYTGLVKVSDNYAPGQNTNPLLEGKDGIARVHPTVNPLEGKFDIAEFASYQSFNIEISWGTELPVAILNTVPPDGTIPQYRTIELDGTASYDPDGFIIQYEFDFDWDGDPDNFVADVTNVTGTTLSDYYTELGTYMVGLKVTDNIGAPGYDSAMVYVEEGCVIFVDDDNTDGPWDGSINYPYQYVQDAVDNTPDACTIWIRPGMYHEDFMGGPTSDQAEIYINQITDLTIHGEDFPQIIMHDYTGPNVLAAIHGFKSHGLMIDGLQFVPAYTYLAAIYLDGCNGGKVRNCTITPEAGFKQFFHALGCNNSYVANNDFGGMVLVDAPDSTLFYLDGCTNSLVAENMATNISHDGTDPTSSSFAFVTCYSSTNDTIAKNIFGGYNCVGSSLNADVKCVMVSSGNNTIHNNLFFDISFENTNAFGTTTTWAVHADHCNNMAMYNNTFDNIGTGASLNGTTYGIELDQSHNPDVYNNIFSNLAGPSSGFCYGAYANTTMTQDYSDVWNLSGLFTMRYALLASEGPGGIEDDPMYTDTASKDYTLQPGSPCKGTGLNGDDMGCYGGIDPLPNW